MLPGIWRLVHRHADPITTPQAVESVIGDGQYLLASRAGSGTPVASGQATPPASFRPFTPVRRYPPGGRYVVFLEAAASISAGVRRTVVRTLAPPPALTASAAAATETLSG